MKSFHRREDFISAYSKNTRNYFIYPRFLIEVLLNITSLGQGIKTS